VRESLFTRLGDLRGTAVLDLYAGTGVLGVEALSRGATSVVFVERAPRCVAVLRRNLRTLGLEGATRVIASDVSHALRLLARRGERFDLVLMDPPYEADEAPRVLEALADCGILGPGATLVVEHHRRHPVPTVPGLAALDSREYGDTVVTRLVAAEVGKTREAPAPR
jgi:16S rRNA (guanine966-N2)-methyltransferase